MSDEMLWNYGWPNRPCERCSDHPGCHNYGLLALERYEYPHSDAKIEEWKRQAAHDAAVARKARDRYERKWIRVGAASWLNGGISLDTVVEMLEAGVLKSMPRDTIRERIKSVSRGS